MSQCEICREPVHSGTCDRYTLMKIVRDQNEELRIFRALDAARQKIPLPGVVMIRSLISHRNQKPRVDMQVGEVHTQMDAETAMDVGKNLIVCATGVYADSFVWHFLKENIQIDDQPALVVIEEFRDYREKLKQEFDQLQKDSPT